jgi:hypothetical protein
VVAATYNIKSLATASRAVLFLPGVFMIDTVWQNMKWVMKWVLAKYEMGYEMILANYEMGYEMVLANYEIGLAYYEMDYEIAWQIMKWVIKSHSVGICKHM